MESVDTFNRHMMALGRESRGLTQSGLAAAMGVGQGTISKIESGTNVAPDDFVDGLVEALSYERSFFYEPGRVLGMPPFHYRKRKKLGTKALAKMIAEMNIRRIHLSILLRSFDRNTNAFIPEIDRDEYLGASRLPFSVESAAQQLRDRWGLPNGPIENVVEMIEDNGGVVIPCNFNSDLIDAVSQRLDGLPVIFFVNMNAPADRIRMTLCHELAHMVLHTTSFLEDDTMETEADRFAGALLMPAKQIRSQLVRFDLRQTAVLKKHWRVSMAAIAMRADNLGLITPYQKKSFFIQMGKLGYRKVEPHEPPKEQPRLMSKILNFHLNVLGYSRDELAKTLMISEGELGTMYNLTFSEGSPESNMKKAAHLSVVK